MDYHLFTSESVSEGHPDKVCDQISDAVLDCFMAEDPDCRCAVETLVTTNSVVLAGEVRGPASITKDVIEETARKTIKKIGYEQKDFHWKDVPIDIKIHKQSSDIAMGVDSSADAKEEEGAGDQGIMFGYACKETDVLMPAAIHYSHRILRNLSKLRHDGTLSQLGPDAKAQLTLRYDENNIPYKAERIVLSTQHNADVTQAQVRDMVLPVIQSSLPDGWLCDDKNIFVNPTGRFVIGGPVGDAGLTGRKIIVDTYGGSAPHGGGAFSGKDPTKVDRSAAYMARYLAKNIVAAGLADRCTIQLAYAIGIAEPMSVFIDTHGTGQCDDRELTQKITKEIKLTPRAIRNTLQLNKPIYTPSAAYGHFGRQPSDEGHFSWERTDLVDTLKSFVQ